jgi:hypothetical protein
LLQFATFRVNGIRGQNICPTTFAPHVWHLRGKLGVNLPYLPHHANRPLVSLTFGGDVFSLVANII